MKIVHKVVGSAVLAAAPLLLLAGPAGAAPAQRPMACPTGALEMFVQHFNSEHMNETLFGANSITANPVAWAEAHEVLFATMAGKAAGSC